MKTVCSSCGFDPSDMTDERARRGLLGTDDGNGGWICAGCYLAARGSSIGELKAVLDGKSPEPVRLKVIPYIAPTNLGDMRL